MLVCQSGARCDANDHVYNVWKQSSNPVTASTRGVLGYEGIDVSYDGTDGAAWSDGGH